VGGWLVDWLIYLFVVWRIESSPLCRRTRPGIIVLSRYLFLLSSFFAVVAFHLSCSAFAPLRLVAILYFIIVHCSVHCLSPIAAIRHCFSSLLFVTALQCCEIGSMTFWCGSGSGSGSADPCLWLIDPDSDPDPGSGSCFLRHRPSRCQQKLIFKFIFSAYYFLKVHLHLFCKDKKSQIVGIKIFLTIFAWW
jgi:hypothetical protein